MEPSAPSTPPSPDVPGDKNQAQDSQGCAAEALFMWADSKDRSSAMPRFHPKSLSFHANLWHFRRSSLFLAFFAFSGEADEEAFAEECRRRGQHALPFQPTNTRLLKPHKPASSPRYAYHYNSDEVEEQDRSRVTSSLETPFYLSGYKEGSKRRKQKQREEQKKKKSTKGSY
uniref:Uncharacterized protein n=1 Tax=Anas zonorhyncha TaxID=75864 RepID=A0A8B9ZN98_9AVES